MEMVGLSTYVPHLLSNLEVYNDFFQHSGRIIATYSGPLALAMISESVMKRLLIGAQYPKLTSRSSF
jgi:hypothetical protein